jgi:hypothetical protein
MNTPLMNAWILGVCLTFVAVAGCKSTPTATPEATSAETPKADPAETPAMDARTQARLEAAQKQRKDAQASQRTARIPKTRSVEEHKEITRKRINADNYKEALDRLERAVGNLERAVQRTPASMGGKRPPSAR